MEFLKPDNLNNVWASGGDRLYPGDTKYASGWGVEIPPRQYFNQIDYKQDQMLAHLNQRGIAEWDDETEYQAGKSYVQGSDGLIYKALTTHTNINPVGGLPGTWQSAFLTSETATKVSTATQSRSLTANDVFLSPLQLANAFTGVNSNLAISGSQKLPSGLILQWGVTPQISSTTGDAVFTFPQPFAAIYQLLLVPGTSTAAPLVVTNGAFTNTNFTFSVWNGASRTPNNAARYLAIGV